eukprot:5983344-Alexandrium_andersonii.AAC.1
MSGCPRGARARGNCGRGGGRLGRSGLLANELRVQGGGWKSGAGEVGVWDGLACGGAAPLWGHCSSELFLVWLRRTPWVWWAKSTLGRAG